MLSGSGRTVIPVPDLPRPTCGADLDTALSEIIDTVDLAFNGVHQVKLQLR
jgi:hypothetical protein